MKKDVSERTGFYWAIGAALWSWVAMAGLSAEPPQGSASKDGVKAGLLQVDDGGEGEGSADVQGREWRHEKGIIVQMVQLSGAITFSFRLSKESELGDLVLLSVREQKGEGEGPSAIFGIYEGAPPSQGDLELTSLVVLSEDDLARWVFVVDSMREIGPNRYQSNAFYEWGLSELYDSSLLMDADAAPE